MSRRERGRGASSSSGNLEESEMYHAWRNMADALEKLGSQCSHQEHSATVKVGSRRTVLREFKKLNPSIFKENNNPEAAENWLNEIRKLMEIADISQEQRVILASSSLIEEADFGWDSIKNPQY